VILVPDFSPWNSKNHLVPVILTVNICKETCNLLQLANQVQICSHAVISDVGSEWNSSANRLGGGDKDANWGSSSRYEQCKLKH
jgi:hypothetical protein